MPKSNPVVGPMEGVTEYELGVVKSKYGGSVAFTVIIVFASVVKI